MFSLKSWVRRWNPPARRPSARKPRRERLAVAPLEDRVVPAVLFSEDFSDNLAGWTLGPEWQIGTATLSTGHSAGNPDPAQDHTPTADNGVAGVRIGGNAATTIHDYYYLTSPVIDTSAASSPVILEFYRWLNSDYAPYMANRVEVFNGTTWQAVWQTGGAPPVMDSSWQRQQFDISAFRNATMQVRFGFNVNASGVYTASSWNLDDVTITSADPPPTADGLAVQIVGAPANSPEGTAITVTASVTDTAGTGPYTYAWSVTKNGVAYPTGTPTTNPSFTFTPDDNGTYVVGLTVTAADGRTAGATSGTGPTDVLIIYDALNTHTQALKNALEAAGFNVALSDTVETLFNGSNPSLAPYEAVIHLNGITWTQPMPLSGQNALVGYVQNGGAYLGSEWNAYEVRFGAMGPMRDLVLFDYQSERGSGTVLTLTEVAALAGHPILANVPPSVSFTAGALIGPAHTFATNPVSVLMNDQFGNPALAVRDFGAGRVVAFHNSGNYGVGTALSDPELQQLYIDGVKWGSRGGAGGPATIMVTNVAPTATVANTGPVDEGGTAVTVSLAGAADPSPVDTAAGFRYSFATSTAGLATSYAAAGTANSGQFVFADSGAYTVFARVFDKDGFRDYQTTVTVANVAPTATLSDNDPVAQGTPVTLTFSGATDPSPADRAAGFRYSFATSPSGLAATYLGAGVSASGQLTFADAGTHTAYGRVFDKDGGFRDYTTSVTVVAAPQVTITGAPADSPEGTAITLGSSVTDPMGDHGPYTYAWSVTKNGAAYPTGTPTNGASFTFTPNDNATYVVSLSVTSADGRTGSGSSSTGSTDVLIIYDSNTVGTSALRNALVAAGFNVALSTTSETLYNGTNPFLTPYEAVIHLDGITWPTAMPTAGQQALASYVQNGGAYIGSEWLSYEASSHPFMRDLILFNYGGSSYGPITYFDIPAQAAHPVLANVPSQFSFQGGRAFTTAHAFATNPVTVLMHDQGNSAAVAVREVGSGRVVGFNHSGNDGASFGTLSDPNVQRLFIDGVRWAARVDAGTVGGDNPVAIMVTNVAPSATVTNNGPVPETGPVTFTYSNVTDPSPVDTAAGFRYSFGTSLDDLATSYAAASPSPVGQVTPINDGNVLFYTRVHDKDGGFRDYPAVVTVTKVAPTATITTGGPVEEGKPATVRLVNPVDSLFDRNTLRYSFATSEAELAASYAAAGTANSRQFTFAENGSYTVYGRVFDNDGLFTTYQTTVTVTNAAPTVTITGAPANSPEGTAITLGSTVTDPGTSDTFTYAWDVTKNGSAYPTGTPTTNPSFTFTPDDNGTFVVTLTVTDDDGGVGEAGSAAGPTDVLIIYDVATAAGTTALRNALTTAGMNVALSTTSETLYNGTNPFLTPYEAVIHLNGTTWSTDMPGAGQQALVSYVQNGGGYIGSEWNAWEFGQGRLRLMGDLILIATTGSSSGSLTLTDVPGQSGHPILANVPSPAFFSGGFTFGQVRAYSGQPATALMRDQFGNDAVAVREFGSGRVVAFHNAGNYTSGTLTDPDLVQLYVDGVRWAARAGTGPGATITVTNVAPALAEVVATGAAEGGVASVTGRVTDAGTADTHTVTVAWGDGTASTAVVSADGTFTATHVYRDDNPSGTPADVYQLGVSARDDDGGLSGDGARELVTNGGFENGFTGWTLLNQGGGGSWAINNGSLDPPGPGTPTAPISGAADALTGQLGPSLMILSEPVTVPANVTSAVLSWSDRIRNHASVFSDPNQEWRVRVIGATGAPLATVYSTNPGDPLQQLGPNHRSFDLTSLLQGLGGQIVRLSFEVEDNLFYFNVNLDDVSLLVSTGPGIPLTVTNVAPGAPALAVGPTVGEDGTVTLTGTYTDAGVDDTHTVAVDWGDGSQTVLGGGATVPVSQAVEYNGHRYFVVRQQGLSWFEAQEQAQRLGGNLVTINDAAENSFVSELLRQNFGYYAQAWIGFSDERSEGRFEWASGEASAFTSWFPQDGEPNDFPPQVTEDFAVTNYAFNFGPGWWNDLSGTRDSAVFWGVYAVVEVSPTRTFTLSHRYADDGAFPITVTVTDDDTGSSTASAVATVVNSAPAALAVTADAVTVNEDGSVTLTGSFADRGTLDAHAVTIDWKDGSVSQVPVPAFEGTPSVNVTLTASAEFGGHTYHFVSTPLSWDAAEAEARRMGGHLVTINSAAENLFLLEYIRRAARQGDVQTWIGLSDGGGTGPFRWASGEALGFTAWAAGEPGNPAGPTGIAFNYNNTQIGARWGDFPAGTPLFAVIEVDGRRTFTATHRYLDDAPSGTPADVYSIGVSVADDDGAGTATTVPVTVANVAPVIASLTGPVAGTPTAATPGGPAVLFTGVRGQPLAFSTAFADVGTLDTHEVRWDFGDGTATDWAATSGYTSAAPAHAYTATGAYTLTVSVRDDDGGVVSFAQQVEIKVIEMQADPNDPARTTIAVGGTTGDDDIEIDTGSVQVFLGGVSLGSYHPTGSITVFAGAGDDDVRVAGSVALPAWIHGGAGNDRIKGGAGHDVLLGGAGDDLLVGGLGRDLLIAGAGADRVVGNADDDIMIAGTTEYDDDRLALGLLRGVWLDPTRTAAERIAALQSPATLPDGVRLDATTVFHDDSADVMTGSSGNDWFLLDTSRDRATDQSDDAFDADREFIENP